MTVYVDDMLRTARVGQISGKWSHLVADSPEELVAFAAQLELRPEWLQHPGTVREHYDVTAAVRDQALALGAQPITYPREIGAFLARRRAEFTAETAGITTGFDRSPR